MKFADRQLFADLLTQRGSGDETMMIKNGFVTDCTIANLIFKKQGEWFTPSTPLLKGTQRVTLLDECAIRLQMIDKFEEIRLINVLNGL